MISSRTWTFLTILMIASCTAWSGTSSLTVPFPIGKAGSATNAEFLVRERQTYAFKLRYEYKEQDQFDRAKVWKLAGGAVRESTGKWVESGAPLKIKVIIFQRDDGKEQIVMEKIVERPRLSSWGAGNLDAELIAVTLMPGHYGVTAVNLDKAPSFVDARTSLFIGRAYRGE